jgi:hypothetical protein
MPKNRKSFVNDAYTENSHRVAASIITRRPTADNTPTKKIRAESTDKTSVGKTRIKPTDKTPVEKIRDNPTYETTVEKSSVKPIKNRRVVKAREIKSRRVELIVTPSIYDRLTAEASEAGESINGTINQIIEIYFAEKDDI